MATEIDIEQSTQIAALEKDVELLREEVDKYKDKEHESLLVVSFLNLLMLVVILQKIIESFLIQL